MYQGKHLHSSGNRNKHKSFALLLSLILLMVFTVAGTTAWLMTASSGSKNTFTPGQVACRVEESFNGQTKENVKIRNTGNTDAFIRAAVVITWQDPSGNVYGAQQPIAGTDYTLSIGNDWTARDGYYYYSQSVLPNALTTNLIHSCTVIKAAPAQGYTLHVEILADAIQSNPISAVQEAWNVTISKSN